MIIESENTMKQLVTEIISSDYVDIVSGKGLSFDDSIVYDKRYSHITENEEYPMMVSKVNAIINLVNENPSLVIKDVETELWDMV